MVGMPHVNAKHIVHYRMNACLEYTANTCISDSINICTHEVAYINERVKYIFYLFIYRLNQTTKIHIKTDNTTKLHTTQKKHLTINL